MIPFYFSLSRATIFPGHRSVHFYQHFCLILHIYKFISMIRLSYRKGHSMVKSHTFEQLPLQNKQALLRIFDGTDLPPLYSDIIAKSVFNADVHPDRLNFLLRNIAVDDTIDVRSGASNEGLHQSKNSKAMVSSAPRRPSSSPGLSFTPQICCSCSIPCQKRRKRAASPTGM